jgi:hypothetical protein
MVGGAWPFLVGGVNRLLNCDNERDLHLLNSYAQAIATDNFLERLTGSYPWEAGGNNRSVMPLDVLGRTRATLKIPASSPVLVREDW